MPTSSKDRSYFIAILLLSGLIIVSAIAQLYYNETEEEPVRILIRWTAKLAAILFAIAFGTSSLHYFIKGEITQQLLTYRPFFGLAFMVFHTFHLIFLIGLQYQIHPVFTLAKTSSLMGGSMAYAFMFAMAFTTFSFGRSKISLRNWKLLHTLGGYWIWFIFFKSYLRNVMVKEQYYGLLALFVIVMMMRIARCLSQKSTKKQSIIT